MDESSYRLNFDLGKKNKIQIYSWNHQNLEDQNLVYSWNHPLGYKIIFAFSNFCKLVLKARFN
jgi:hypothetical protein